MKIGINKLALKSAIENFTKFSLSDPENESAWRAVMEFTN